MANKHFTDLLVKGNPAGEVISVDRFLVHVSGLHNVNRHALVMFDDGSKGIVWSIDPDSVLVLHLGYEELSIGAAVVIQNQGLFAKVGEGFLGRVISVTGEPLDGKGTIAADRTWPIFNVTPGINQRMALDTQIPTGVTVADTLFPLVRGQRMAILGESKSGKSSFITQIAMAQKNTDQVMVFGLVAKRRADIDDLLRRLNDSGVMSQCIVVVSTVFDSLVTSYLVPYVACAHAEYFWQDKGRDAIIAYDDLTSHAMVYREISLLGGASPGRDSYPGDTFYAHSSLLERAGRLSGNSAALTALGIVLINNGDMTAYLPTNIMSITDGQYIFDLELFRLGVRPAIHTGLSVSRVGDRGLVERQKINAAKVFKQLAAYREASEVSHFGSELALQAQADLETGKQILEIMKQGPLDMYSIVAQQLMLEIVLELTQGSSIDLYKLKQLANDYALKVTDESLFDSVKKELLEACAIEIKSTSTKMEVTPPTEAQAEGKKK